VTRLLIVSYLFPPVGGVGVQRALSLAKYLPQCGFDVHVLKARNAAGPVHDPGLLQHVPSSVWIYEAFTPELPFHFRQKVWRWFGGGKQDGSETSATNRPPRNPWWKRLPVALVRRILCPEPEVMWVPFALRKARQIVKKYGIEAVLVTAPPFSAFLVGNALKKEFPGLKLIADFRDEWLSFYLKDFEFQNGDYTRRRAGEIERATVELSDLVVAVTRSTLDVIRKRYPDEPDRKFFHLPNGYDPEVFRWFQPRKCKGDRIVVTHLGTAYTTASPRYYLDALDAMPEEIRSRIETQFIGRISDWERTSLEGRKSFVRVLGFMPQAEALRQVEETDYLLLTMTNDISLPGKLFEYLAMRKPILALSPTGGEVHRLLEETGAGMCVDPGDPEAIQSMIRKALDLAGSETWFSTRNDELIRSFGRPVLTAQYGEAIRALLEHRTVDCECAPAAYSGA
jgi:glycosyltransferase involved in cell wall biosynthesis